MKTVVSVVGARPNFMKVAPLHREFASHKDVNHIIVHTGQHYDVNMSDAFFKDLEMPQPEYFLGVGSASHAAQTAKIMMAFEEAALELSPDLVIVVGDVNSTIAAALTAAKLGIKAAHVEGGLRSFDRTMPEEINRIATDSICDYCFVTEESALKNLKHEGFREDNIFFTGNTMIDSQKYAMPKAEKSDILERIGLTKGEYAAVTVHRPSNVDDTEQLYDILRIFDHLSKYREIVLPMHPRTRKNLEFFDFMDYAQSIEGLKLIEPLGYIDFLALMKNSDFVITDSGGIQEETTVLGLPCITIRTTTERPVTTEIGTNILVMPEYENIRKEIDRLLHEKRKTGKIPEFWDGFASVRIVNQILKLI